MNYSVHREDSNSEGGVFIAIRETLVSASMPDINVSCEVIWACWQFSDCKLLYIASYYGPHSNKQEALNELTESLSIIFHNRGQICQMSSLVETLIFQTSIMDSWSTKKPSTATDRRYFLKFLLENLLSQLAKVVT